MAVSNTTQTTAAWEHSILSDEQQQQIFVVTDLNVSPKWEINIGVGVGPTAGTDHWIIKAILGRHFDWKKPSLVD